MAQYAAPSSDDPSTNPLPVNRWPGGRPTTGRGPGRGPLRAVPSYPTEAPDPAPTSYPISESDIETPRAGIGPNWPPARLSTRPVEPVIDPVVDPVSERTVERTVERVPRPVIAEPVTPARSWSPPVEESRAPRRSARFWVVLVVVALVLGTGIGLGFALRQEIRDRLPDRVQTAVARVV